MRSPKSDVKVLETISRILPVFGDQIAAIWANLAFGATFFPLLFPLFDVFRRLKPAVPELGGARHMAGGGHGIVMHPEGCVARDVGARSEVT